MTDARSGCRIGLLALAGLLLTNAALGPVGLDLLRYPLPESLLNQLRGLEIVTVGLVVPCLLLAAGLVRRGRREAPLLAVGPCAYASYMFVGARRHLLFRADHSAARRRGRRHLRGDVPDVPRAAGGAGSAKGPSQVGTFAGWCAVFRP